MDNIVEIRNLKKSFGTKSILNDLSFNIPRGKISFIIGRSGEGKSVTIKHIIGILKPDSGEIIIDNIPMHHANESTWEKMRLKIGILFQDGALFDSLSVFENIAFPIINCLTLSEHEVRQKVEQLLASVGLSKIGNKYPTEISIGEKKRVGLARALALDPKLLLYDEPTTSMDPIVADLIDTLIKVTQEKTPGLTTVVISHDVVSMMKVAEYIFLLHQGRVYFQGSPQDFQNSQDALVKQFLNGDLHGPLDVPLV
ncbi:MAG: ATP-binding cassette domain-containing protein [Bdellovibrionota bacterium]